MFLPDLARDIFPDWNIRPQTYIDCKEYCDRHQIWLIWCDDEQEEYGCYMVSTDDQEIIVLNKNLDPIMLLWVFLHEIFHRRAHYPNTSHFSPQMNCKNDAEANDFAAAAMMPRPLIEGEDMETLINLYQFPSQLVQIRKMMADRGL